jgi:hypothetical protein
MKKSAKRAMKKEEAAEAPATFAPVAAAFAEDRAVSSGTMMASFGLRVNGKIFAMFVRGKLVAKLPKARVDELVSNHKGERFDPRRDGRLMKEWVVVEAGGANWVELARESYRFLKGGPSK